MPTRPQTVARLSADACRCSVYPHVQWHCGDVNGISFLRPATEPMIEDTSTSGQLVPVTEIQKRCQAQVILKKLKRSRLLLQLAPIVRGNVPSAGMAWHGMA